MSKRRKTYIKKSKTGPQGHDEWVVRIELDYGNYAICGCPGRWEAEFVKACISAAMGSPNPSVRLERMLKELEETF